MICVPSRSTVAGRWGRGVCHLGARVSACPCVSAGVSPCVRLRVNVEGLMECWLPGSKQASVGNCGSTVQQLKNEDTFHIRSPSLQYGHTCAPRWVMEGMGVRVVLYPAAGARCGSWQSSTEHWATNKMTRRHHHSGGVSDVFQRIIASCCQYAPKI